jgi:hypothetical protein
MVNRTMRVLKAYAERFVFSTKSIHASCVSSAKSEWKEFKDSFWETEVKSTLPLLYFLYLLHSSQPSKVQQGKINMLWKLWYIFPTASAVESFWHHCPLEKWILLRFNSKIFKYKLFFEKMQAIDHMKLLGRTCCDFKQYLQVNAWCVNHPLSYVSRHNIRLYSSLHL